MATPDELDARRRLLIACDDDDDRATLLAAFARVDQRRHHRAMSTPPDDGDPGPLYRRCEDESCPFARAYTDGPHYHYRPFDP